MDFILSSFYHDNVFSHSHFFKNKFGFNNYFDTIKRGGEQSRLTAEHHNWVRQVNAQELDSPALPTSHYCSGSGSKCQ